MSSMGEGEIYTGSEAASSVPVAAKPKAKSMASRRKSMADHDAPRSAKGGLFSTADPDFRPQHAAIGKEARELYFEGFAVSADNFASVAAKFGVLQTFYQFMEAPPVRLTDTEKVDQIVNCVSTKSGGEPVWRRCKVNISLSQAVVRLHDVDANLSFMLNIRTDKAPSTKTEDLEYLRGKDMGEGKPRVDAMSFPVTVWVHNKDVPIVLLFTERHKQVDLARCLCLLTSYRALLDREVSLQDQQEAAVKRICNVSPQMDVDTNYGACYDGSSSSETDDSGSGSSSGSSDEDEQRDAGRPSAGGASRRPATAAATARSVMFSPIEGGRQRFATRSRERSVIVIARPVFDVDNKATGETALTSRIWPADQEMAISQKAVVLTQ